MDPSFNTVLTLVYMAQCGLAPDSAPPPSPLLAALSHAGPLLSAGHTKVCSHLRALLFVPEMLFFRTVM